MPGNFHGRGSPVGCSPWGRTADWVAPGDYGKYAAVLLVDRDKSSGKWSAKSDIDALRKYLQNGGTVILGGHAIMDLGGARRSLKSLEKLLGYSVVGAIPPRKYKAVSFTAEVFLRDNPRPQASLAQLCRDPAVGVRNAEEA